LLPMLGFGHFLSLVFGWTYFTAWSVSFMPQIILNWKRKSVQGLSIDFLAYNVVGFGCYAAYMLSYYYSDTVQKEYEERYHSPNLVQFNDVLFATYALGSSLVTWLQYTMYKSDPDQRMSRFGTSCLAVVSAVVGAALFQKWTGKAGWIDVLQVLSTIKLCLSIVKYCPQIYLNYKAKSTVGWSIHNILLDLTGSLFSMAQLFLDAYLVGSWSGLQGLFVKWILGLVVVCFDTVFIVQHYVLYTNRADVHLAREQQPLLEPST